MKKSLLAATAALVFGLSSAPGFAGSYVVNGHAASPAEVQLLTANGAQPGTWVVNGYGIAPGDRAASEPQKASKSSSKSCYYVLDVLLCD
ncbi:MAG TPA: hypothetical protein VH855_04955 [Acetobacteraceae bacterium]|jgi:hypothetical protein